MSRFAQVLVLAFFGLGCDAAHAGALQVSPLGVRLTDQQPIATLRVRNVDAREVIIQADVFTWTQPDGNDLYAATDEVVVIPPIFSLAPGAQQLLRVGLPEPVPSSGVERAFRVFLRELRPVEAQSDGQLNLALRIGLPIFVLPPGDARAGELVWGLVANEGSPSVLRVRNRSAEHIKITAVRFLTEQGSLADEVRMLRYCLPGAEVTIALPALESAGEASHIQVRFTSGDRSEIENIALANGSLAAR